MIGLLVRALVGAGLSQEWARRAAPILLAFAALVLVVVGAKLWFAHHDAGVIAGHEAQLDARAAPARDNAADQRATDAQTIQQTERAYHDAIDNSGSDGPPDNASLALNCERLRRAGIALSAPCGPGRGD